MVIGIGNPDRGDDVAGRAVARRLRGGVVPLDVDIVEHDGDVASLLGCLEGAGAAYLVDACVSRAPAGTVRRFDVRSAPLPRLAFELSTHGLGLAEALELGRALGQLPDRCILYAIEIGAVEPNASTSPAVTAAIDEVCELLRAELSAPEDAASAL